jgi:DNA invertase Pin-like site-specific DNA recombinase
MTTSLTKGCAIYVRSATNGPETEAALGNQEAACRAYVDRNGYRTDPCHVYRDIVSGLAPFADRPQMKLLYQAVEQGDIDGIIAASPDRLARDLKLFTEFVGWANQHNVAVEFAVDSRS